MAEKFWSGVNFALESAAASAVAITGISNEDPAVVTHSGADPSNGELVRISAPGMTNLDDRVFRVANAGVGTFELEGLDSSLENAFVSGSFEVITYGTVLTNITDIASSGGEANKTTYQFLSEKVEREKTTGFSAIERTITMSWDPADAGIAALRALDGLTRSIQLTFEDGSLFLFNGEIAFLEEPAGAANELVTTTLVLSSQGKGTSYGV